MACMINKSMVMTENSTIACRPVIGTNPTQWAIGRNGSTSATARVKSTATVTRSGGKSCNNEREVRKTKKINICVEMDSKNQRV